MEFITLTILPRRKTYQFWHSSGCRVTRTIWPDALANRAHCLWYRAHLNAAGPAARWCALSPIQNCPGTARETWQRASGIHLASQGPRSCLTEPHVTCLEHWYENSWEKCDLLCLNSCHNGFIVSVSIHMNTTTQVLLPEKPFLNLRMLTWISENLPGPPQTLIHHGSD